MYEDDFKKERSERENLNTQKERLTRELSDAKATIAGLQRQLKQVYTVDLLDHRNNSSVYELRNINSRKST